MSCFTPSCQPNLTLPMLPVRMAGLVTLLESSEDLILH